MGGSYIVPPPAPQSEICMFFFVHIVVEVLSGYLHGDAEYVVGYLVRRI